jgi:hypothetical protein
MAKKLQALETALKGRKVHARSKAEIEADLDEAIEWAETKGRALPIRVKRGRPAAGEPPRETRSVTVRFPAGLALQVEAAAEREGLSLSEFVRGAAVVASRAKKAAPKVARARVRPAAVRGR